MTLTLRRLLTAGLVLLTLGALPGCASMTDAAIGFERSRADLSRHEVQLPDGLKMAYLEGGQGEPLVLVHGFGGNKDNFTRVAKWLSPHYHVIVPDVVGFGESSHPQDVSYAYAEQARRLHAFVHALGLKKPHLGGNSMGGGIVLSYAVQYREEVASLWLLDAAGLPEAPPSELRRILEAGGANPLIVSTEDDFAKVVNFAMSDPPYIPGPMMKVMAHERMANRALEEKIFGQIARESLSDSLRGLQTPALIVWGSEDRLLDVGTAEMLHGLLPRSQVVVMPKVGHVPMVERPQETADDYLKFRASLATSAR